MFFERDLTTLPTKAKWVFKRRLFCFQLQPNCKKFLSLSGDKEAKQGNCYMQDGTGKKWTKAKGKKASENKSSKQGVGAGSP